VGCGSGCVGGDWSVWGGRCLRVLFVGAGPFWDGCDVSAGSLR